MSAADPTGAVAAYLAAQPEVFAAAQERIFRPELPQEEQPHMPRACLLVRPAGGGSMSARDFLNWTDSRLDIVCYGSTRLQAENIAREAALAMKELGLSKWESTRLLWARIAGNPASAIDPETNWPFALVVVQVGHSMTTV